MRCVIIFGVFFRRFSMVLRPSLRGFEDVSLCTLFLSYSLSFLLSRLMSFSVDRFYTHSPLVDWVWLSPRSSCAFPSILCYILFKTYYSLVAMFAFISLRFAILWTMWIPFSISSDSFFPAHFSKHRRCHNVSKRKEGRGRVAKDLIFSVAWTFFTSEDILRFHEYEKNRCSSNKIMNKRSWSYRSEKNAI